MYHLKCQVKNERLSGMSFKCPELCIVCHINIPNLLILIPKYLIKRSYALNVCLKGNLFITVKYMSISGKCIK